MTLDLDAIRSRFPALQRTEGGTLLAWLDAPAGTQVPRDVIAATAAVQERGVANLGGPFAASEEAAHVVTSARAAAADLLGADPAEIAFGQNMTSLTFAVSRAISREWAPRDRIVVTSLDHDANVTPWRRAAEERGVDVDVIDFDRDTGLLDPDAVAAAIDERTRLVAVTAASNALGSTTDLAPITAAAGACGALTFVDAVHYSAHRLSDVRAIDCDFLAASAYKFFGPHTGLLYGKKQHLKALRPYKVAPAPEASPDRWETGTQSFESLAGLTAAIDYLASLGTAGRDRRDRLVSAFDAIRTHEESLSNRFLAGLAEMPHLRLYGPATAGDHRVSTFAVAVAGMHPRHVAEVLAERGIHVWDGHYYAVGVMERLGLAESGGLVRIGFVHYTTVEEVDRVLAVLDELRRWDGGDR